MKEGSGTVLRENAYSLFELDLTNSTFEKDVDFKTWCGNDYDTRVNLMNDYFPDYFNEYNEGLKITSDATKAKYKMILHIDDFVRKVGSFYGAKSHMRIYGNIMILDLGTNKIICNIRIEKLDGPNDFVESDRFPKVMKALAKKLAKLE